MNALRRIRNALVAGGLLLDLQPLGGRIPVHAGHPRLGTLDMREWAQMVEAVTARIDAIVGEGLFAVVAETHYEVLETFDDGEELVATVRDWTGTKISSSLAARVRRATPPLTIHERVRLRVLRAS